MEVMEKEEKKVLDLSGLMCPLPIVITSEKVRRLKEGEVITVISTDPGFERDIYNWSKQTGNQLLSIKKENALLEEKLKLLREDKDLYLEKLAREKMQLQKPDEKIILFKE